MVDPKTYYKNYGFSSFLKVIPQYLMKKLQYHYYNINDFPFRVNGAKIKIDISSMSEFQAAKFISQSEKIHLEDLLDELRPNDVFWDVGANIGIFSCLASQKISDGEVIAFEPYPPNVRSLKKNISLNNLDVGVMERALSDSEGIVDFKIPMNPEPGYQLGGITPEGSDGNKRTKEVEAISGDTLVQEEGFSLPSVVKIDVEGGTPLVLEGIKDILESEECRVVYSEIHEPAEIPRYSSDDFGYRKDSVLEMLKDLGFQNQVINNRDKDVQVKSVK